MKVSVKRENHDCFDEYVPYTAVNTKKSLLSSLVLVKRAVIFLLHAYE